MKHGIIPAGTGMANRAALLSFSIVVLTSTVCVPIAGFAQSASATLSGAVVDESGGALADVNVSAVNTATNVQRDATTNREGTFTLTTLHPGRYVVKADRQGFTPTEIRDVVLNVGDHVAITIQMKVAEVGEAVTVVAETPRVNTSAAVGTVVNRQFVENLPLNGRSLQSLLELTPGVVLTRTGDPTTGSLGQFSVNGQRTNANYWTVDGVSANVGINGGAINDSGQSGSGQTPALTALGGTNGLVSIDALQEFRIETSTYAPEFGRMPGGQVSLVTRAGTNAFHGSLFEYFRDDALDATDWFVNANQLPKPELRQHQFGGVLGGPIRRDRAFFFVSYEGLRLEQPRAIVQSHPTVETRRTAPASLQPYLNALPLPNGKDVGGGFAAFAASYSDPSRFDTTSGRVDYHARPGLTFFTRVSHAPSSSRVRAGGLGYFRTTHSDNRSMTAGSTWVVSNRVVHDLRVNYTTTDAPFTAELDGFGGGVVPPTSVFRAGRGPENAYFAFIFEGGIQSNWQWGTGTAFRQRQVNLVDSLTVIRGSHELKAGLDFRRVHPVLGGTSQGVESLVFDVPGLSTSQALVYQLTARDPTRHAVAFDNLSAYVQDTWKASARLTLSYGLRWEYVPPPHATEGGQAITLDHLDAPFGGQVRIAPRGTPLWETRYNNLAPRVGASYVLSDVPGRELVVRGGVGIFHDLGFGQVASAYTAYPFHPEKWVLDTPFPLSPDVLALPRLVEDPPQNIWVMDRHLVLPRTYQWNVSAERSLGRRQTVTVSYVGAEGRDLLNLSRYNIVMQEWPTARVPVNINRNRGFSDYRALQLQYQRRMSRGLQALASYTFGRSRDTSSSDLPLAGQLPSERLPVDIDYGYSDYDVRHVFTAAVTYQMGTVSGPALWRSLASRWGVDVMVRARSGFPVSLLLFAPFEGDFGWVRPDVIPGQPFWIDDRSSPGGRRLNRQAFTPPPANAQGNLPRGAVRGFNARQADIAVRRDFALARGMRLQVRLEVFNLLNTPNFADPRPGSLGGNFGVSNQMLAQGLGGLSALYQIGGPRSIQIATKLVF